MMGVALQMMVKQDSLPFTFNTNRPSRFGIVDRCAPSCRPAGFWALRLESGFHELLRHHL